MHNYEKSILKILFSFSQPLRLPITNFESHISNLIIKKNILNIHTMALELPMRYN